MSWRILALAWAAVVSIGGGGALGGPPVADNDDVRLAEARRLVEKSDRYLSHTKLQRGMEGYGLTVMAGTEVVKFHARVVSVVTKWGPHQDVILAMLSGLDLEHSGIIAGMSGSPVYFKDPADDKYKLVGAVAYGWRGQKDPLCGIQPVTQMLVARGGLGGEGKAAASYLGGADSASASPRLDKHLAALLDPRKINFLAAYLGRVRKAGCPRGGRGGPGHGAAGHAADGLRHGSAGDGGHGQGPGAHGNGPGGFRRGGGGGDGGGQVRPARARRGLGRAPGQRRRRHVRRRHRHRRGGGPGDGLRPLVLRRRPHRVADGPGLRPHVRGGNPGQLQDGRGAGYHRHVAAGREHGRGG